MVLSGLALKPAPAALKAFQKKRAPQGAQAKRAVNLYDRSFCVFVDFHKGIFIP